MGPQEAIDACRYYAGLLVGGLARCVEKETLLSPRAIAQSRVSGTKAPWRNELPRSPTGRSGTENRRRSKEPATSWNRWRRLSGPFNKSQDFREGALLAANLGDDADTTAAIYGQIAGATYGVEAIPPEWRAVLTMVTEITSMADSLYGHARQTLPATPHPG